HPATHFGNFPHEYDERGDAFNCDSFCTQTQSIYSGEKPYVYNNCGNAINLTSFSVSIRGFTLERNHMNVRTETKPSDRVPTWLSIRESTLERNPLRAMNVGLLCGSCYAFPIEHQRIHTGGKQYECKECNKALRQSTHLNQHQRIHTGEKPYECSAVMVHTLISIREFRWGKSYECNKWGAAFPQTLSLRLHQRIHAGENPYKSSEYGTSFSCSSALRGHQRIHNREAL
ncbi:hypothetical protein U0070_016303, partial [Myodes glareolus]